MKKYLLISLFLLEIITSVKAQDTIIEHDNFTLQISRVTERTNPYEYIKTGEKFDAFEYQWTNASIRGIIEDWMIFMELEVIEYRIEENVATRKNLFQFRDKEGLIIDWKNNDSIDITKYLNNNDVVTTFLGYNVVYKRNTPHNEHGKAINKTAFMVLCDVMNLEIEMVSEPVTYWKLEIVDTQNSSVSYDQNTHWKRTDLEEYIYYERIKYRRIADLLSRKLGAFVKPIPYNAQKFDIRMPYSDDVFDLKYAMIEHGLELTEVTEEIEVMVIREKE